MTDAERPDEAPTLRRSLGLPLLVFYGVGTILGLGIYVLLGKVAGEAGMLSPLAFLVAAFVASLTGLSYGALSARIPKSAGEVNYVDEAFGRRFLSGAVGWLIIVSAIISTSTVVNGYVGYVHVFVELPPWLVILGISLLLDGVAAWGIHQSAFTITAITAIEILGLLVVIVIARGNLAELPARWREFLPTGGFSDFEMVMGGAFLAFFTFIGFEDMVNVAEEATDPRRSSSASSTGARARRRGRPASPRASCSSWRSASTSSSSPRPRTTSCSWSSCW